MKELKRNNIILNDTWEFYLLTKYGFDPAGDLALEISYYPKTRKAKIIYYDIRNGHFSIWRTRNVTIFEECLIDEWKNILEKYNDN